MPDTEYRRGRNAMEIADEASGRSPNRKSKWERAGMTRDEYERGLKQLAEEKARYAERDAVLNRARRGQSNPGN